MVKLRQVSKEWKKGLKGYEWLTQGDIDNLPWPETLGSRIGDLMSTCIFPTGVHLLFACMSVLA